MKRLLQPKVVKSVNADLEALSDVQEKIESYQSNLDQIEKKISDSFTECTIMFVDLVDSTKFKLNHPEPTWILRVKLFVDVITQYSNELGGNIVKIIGDEAMITFTRDVQIHDAMNFVMRIKEIENSLKKITGFDTRIKIALDKGPVCFIKYEGNTANDPQGTPIDRCARISKYCQAGTVLTSEFFYNEFEHKDLWKFIGKPKLKGLGNISIYQLSPQTIKAIDMIDIPEEEYDHLISLSDKNEVLENANRTLQIQLKESGKKPDPSATISDNEEDNEDWKEIEKLIDDICKLIDGGPSYSNEYARFVFLYQIDQYEKQDRYKGKIFDELIRANLVYSENENGWYGLNPEHKRNSRILLKINELEILLAAFVDNYGEIDESDLFEYSVTDPEFWEKYISYKVN